MSKLIICTAIIIFCFTLYARQPMLSPDGDTFYIGECAILKDNNIHENQVIPPEYKSNVGLNTIWGPAVRLTRLAERGGSVGRPEPTELHNILVLFLGVGNLGHDYNIFKTFSYNMGDHWTGPDSINMESVGVRRIASSDTVLYLFGGTIASLVNCFFVRSFDQGYTWHDYHEFEPITTSYIGKKTINTRGDSIFTTYNLHNRRYEVIDSIIFSSSTDRGETWSEIRGIMPMYNDFYEHWLKISRNRMHLIYEDFGQGSILEIFYSFSDDFGLTWSDPIFLSDNDSHSSQWPYLSCDDKGNLCVSWFDYKYGSGPSGFTGDILYRISRDNGQTWGPEQRLTYDHLGTASRSVIDEDYISFVWIDHYLGWLHGNLSFTERRLNQTSPTHSWTPKHKITNNGPEHNVFGHELLYDGKSIYLFWQDDRDSDLFDYEIYFKRGLVEPSRRDNSRLPRDVLVSPHPNPFNKSVTIDVRCDTNQLLKLTIYDIKGSLVKELYNGYSQDGDFSLDWDGRDYKGKDVSSGVYLISLQTQNGGDVKKIIFLK